jgi:uncharacterized protein with HEPN domain
MYECSSKALAFVAGKTRDDYDQDEVLRLALKHLVQTIGEAASQISEERRLVLNHIPWRAIIGMRHRIVHGYAMIDDSIVWRTITDELPFLSATLEQILRDEGVSGEA